VMEVSNISHVVGVVNGQMGKLGKEHGDVCFGI